MVLKDRVFNQENLLSGLEETAYRHKEFSLWKFQDFRYSKDRTNILGNQKDGKYVAASVVLPGRLVTFGLVGNDGKKPLAKVTINSKGIVKEFNSIVNTIYEAKAVYSWLSGLTGRKDVLNVFVKDGKFNVVFTDSNPITYDEVEAWEKWK